MNQYAGRRLERAGSYELVKQPEIPSQVSRGRFLRQERIRPPFKKKRALLPNHVGAYLPSQTLLTLDNQHP
jgi:hypothetical protein